MTSKGVLLSALKDVYRELVLDYVQDGGDEEAKTNPHLQKRRKLLDRTEKLIRKAEDDLSGR